MAEAPPRRPRQRGTMRAEPQKAQSLPPPTQGPAGSFSARQFLHEKMPWESESSGRGGFCLGCPKPEPRLFLPKTSEEGPWELLLPPSGVVWPPGGK